MCVYIQYTFLPRTAFTAELGQGLGRTTIVEHAAKAMCKCDHEFAVVTPNGLDGPTSGIHCSVDKRVQPMTVRLPSSPSQTPTRQ
jgi:hypothetical protein